MAHENFVLCPEGFRKFLRNKLEFLFVRVGFGMGSSRDPKFRKLLFLRLSNQGRHSGRAADRAQPGFRAAGVGLGLKIGGPGRPNADPCFQPSGFEIFPGCPGFRIF